MLLNFNVLNFLHVCCKIKVTCELIYGKSGEYEQTLFNLRYCWHNECLLRNIQTTLYIKRVCIEEKMKDTGNNFKNFVKPR